MSSRDSEDWGSHLLAAKERDLEPLLERSSESLDLDRDQVEAMADFLNLAWFSGIHSGREQMEARATQSEPDLSAVALKRLESEFKDLMDRSAETLNLTVSRTIDMWNFLHEAWMRGNRTSETEIMALYIETNFDVGQEALRWLEEKGESAP